MYIPCHIIVENNPAIIYTSRNGAPPKVLPILERFLDKFWQERDLSGETVHTPECLAAQLIVRFGFESCEDDFSNIQVGVTYRSDVQFLYLVSNNRTVSLWVPTAEYRTHPNLGLAACIRQATPLSSI